MKKGTLVKVRAYVNAEYYSDGIDQLSGTTIVCSVPRKKHANRKQLIRSESEFDGIVIGVSHRQIGYGHPSNGYDSMGYLEVTKRIRVVMVIPINTSAYIKPYAVLREDLEIMSKSESKEDVPGVV